MTDNSQTETEPSADELSVGDAYELPGDTTLVVVGVAPAYEAPDDQRDHGPLYECELRGPGGTPTNLYRPHHIETAVEAGAEYAGQRDVATERTPFWCEGCGHARRGEKRHSLALTEAAVCSYGCGREVEAARRRERHQAVREAQPR